MRARNIKPDFFLNEKLAEVSPHERLLFIGLWCLADREGRLEDRPKRIRAAVFPYEDVEVDSMLDRLHQVGFLIRYEVDREKYIVIPCFSKHQQPHYKEAKSVIPALQDGPSPARAAARIAPSLADDPAMIAPSLADDPAMIDRSSTNDRSKKVLDDPLILDSPLLILDSPLLILDSPLLIPDSPLLIPDSLIADSLIPIRLLTSSAKPATEEDGVNFSHRTKPFENPKAQTGNARAQAENYQTEISRQESPPLRAPPPNEDAIEEEPDHESYPSEFEQFWQQYPIQTEKKRAFRLWQNRIKDRVDARDLIQAAKHYAAFCHRRRTDPYYIKDPTTFLGPEKLYKDWIEPLLKGGGNGDGR